MGNCGKPRVYVWVWQKPTETALDSGVMLV